MAMVYDPIEGWYWQDEPTGEYGEYQWNEPPPEVMQADEGREWNPEIAAYDDPVAPPPDPTPVDAGSPAPPVTAAQTTAPSSSSSSYSGGGGGSSYSGPSTGSLLNPYPRTFQRPDTKAAVQEALGMLPAVPQFNAPEIPQIAPWQEPTAQDIYSDPSFDFRKGIGERALMNNKAAQGLLRTGGTLKDLLDYNQNFASQEWGNMRNRKFQGWQGNADTTLRRSGLELDRARSQYEPQFAEYQNKVATVTRVPELEYDRSWREFLADYDIWRDQRDSTYSKLFDQSKLGMV